MMASLHDKYHHCFLVSGCILTRCETAGPQAATQTPCIIQAHRMSICQPVILAIAELTKVLSDMRCLLVLVIISALSIGSVTSGCQECTSFYYNARHVSCIKNRSVGSITNKLNRQPKMSECYDGFIQNNDASNHHIDSQHYQTQLTRRKLVVSSVHFFPAYLFFRANKALAYDQSSSPSNDEPPECKNGGIVSGELLQCTL